MSTDKSQSARVASDLVARCELRLGALLKGGRAEVLKKAHALWVRDAKALWVHMRAADQQKVKDARLALEAAFADAEAALALRTRP